MKTTKLKFLTFFLFILVSFTNSFAQGCSDAGFCSVGNGFKGHEVDLKNSVDIGVVYGIAEEGVTVFSQYLTYTRDVTDKFAISVLHKTIVGAPASTVAIGSTITVCDAEFEQPFASMYE